MEKPTQPSGSAPNPDHQEPVIDQFTALNSGPVYAPQGTLDAPRGPPVPWSNKLLDCCGGEDKKLCATAYFCPCILYSKTRERIQNPRLEGHDNCNGCCCLFWVAGAWSWIMILMDRGEIRKKYNIEGSGGKDCATAFFCHCCALIQQEKEVRKHQALDEKRPGFQPVTPMIAEPQSSNPL